MTISKKAIEAANVPVRERIERLVRDVKDGAIIGYDGPQEYWSTRMGAEASMEIARLLERKLVKVLCWEDAKDKGYSQANCALGQYQVSWLGEFESWQCCRPHRAGLDWKDNFSRHPSKDEAKAAAQADYETRILSALISSPGKDGGQEVEAVGEAAELARLRAISLDMQAGYIEATERAEEAVKAANALQAEVDRLRDTRPQAASTALVKAEDIDKMAAALGAFRASEWWFQTENPNPARHCLSPLVLQNMKLGYENGTLEPTLTQFKNLLTTAIFYQQKCQRLTKALEPFAALASVVDDMRHEDNSTCPHRLRAADIREARAALSASSGKDGVTSGALSFSDGIRAAAALFETAPDEPVDDLTKLTREAQRQRILSLLKSGHVHTAEEAIGGASHD